MVYHHGYDHSIFRIHPFPMLVATGSFSHKRGLPVKFCVGLTHFKSIILSALLNSNAAFSHAINENLIYLSHHLYEFVINE